MTMPDPLERVHSLLGGIVQQDILDRVIATVRAECGGGAVYVHSPARERIAAIQSALRGGTSCKAVAALHGITTQAVHYHRKKL